MIVGTVMTSDINEIITLRFEINLLESQLMNGVCELSDEVRESKGPIKELLPEVAI
jgi:hypothetical protein